MLSSHRRILRIPVTLLAAGLASSLAANEPPLGVDAYVQAVLRSHPAARQATALEASAAAERKAKRPFPDPVVGFSWGRGRPAGEAGPTSNETGLSVSQTIPWPGAVKAAFRAGDRAADALRADAVEARWDLEVEARATFARLLYAHSALEISRQAEADALTLRDLTNRRAELGEAREVDRIKTEVEWLRQQRTRRALERQALAAEAALRTLAVEPQPQPLVLSGELPRALPPLDAADLELRLVRSNPHLGAARAAALRDEELASVSRRSRVPDLDVTWYRDREIDKDSNGLSFGVRVPLWNANRGEIARAEAGAALAAAGAERARIDLVATLTRAAQELETASGQVEILERQILPAAQRSLELARFSYQEGETSLLDLLDAQRTFRETQAESAASRLALALALGEVQRLVGPDFDPGR